MRYQNIEEVNKLKLNNLQSLRWQIFQNYCEVTRLGDETRADALLKLWQSSVRMINTMLMLQEICEIVLANKKGIK